VLLPKAVFQQVAATTAATLKEFLAAEATQVALCELDDPGLDLDIDRPEDYERALLLDAHARQTLEGA
jgi:CTP:molybdopterin cytidylyltransferase MocA